MNFSKNEMIETDDIKTWQTHSVKNKVASVLMTDGIAFSFDEESGIVFTAPKLYVEKLIYRLITSYGCSKRPVINEIK